MIRAALIALVMMICMNAHAATRTAASVAYADVKAQTDLSTDGDTVIIPVGTNTWASTLVLTNSVSLLASGTNSTRIVNSVGRVLHYKDTLDRPFRVSGINFQNADKQQCIVFMEGPIYKARIDHCHFDKGDAAIGFNFWSVALVATGPAYGVVDHCTFRNMVRPIYAMDSRNKDTGQISWSESLSPGDAVIPVVEDCQFENDAELTDSLAQGAVYGVYGARLVFRYNTCRGMNGYIDAHGDSPGYGTRLYEIYGNNFIGGAYKPFLAACAYLRGGTHLFFSNNITMQQRPVAVTMYHTNDVHTITNSFFWGNTWNGGTNQATMVTVRDSGQTPVGWSAARIKVNEAYFLRPLQSGDVGYPYSPIAYPHALIAETEGQGSSGVISLSSASYSVGEDGGTVTATFQRTDGSTGLVAVNYATQDGSAVGGQDFTPASGTVTWGDGVSTNQTVQISIEDDPDVEPDETLGIVLSGLTGGASAGSVFGATVTITDDDNTAEPPLMEGLTWRADAGLILAPYATNETLVVQATETASVSDAGRARYRVTVPTDGKWRMTVRIKAEAGDRNSFFVDVDQDPVSPTAVCDVAVTSGIEERKVSWRGTGTTTPEFPWKEWDLTAGVHEVVVCGRESNCGIYEITLEQVLTSAFTVIGSGEFRAMTVP